MANLMGLSQSISALPLGPTIEDLPFGSPLGLGLKYVALSSPLTRSTSFMRLSYSLTGLSASILDCLLILR